MDFFDKFLYRRVAHALSFPTTPKLAILVTQVARDTLNTDLCSLFDIAPLPFIRYNPPLVNKRGAISNKSERGAISDGGGAITNNHCTLIFH